MKRTSHWSYDSVSLVTMLLPLALVVILLSDIGVVAVRSISLTVFMSIAFAFLPVLARRFSDKVGLVISVMACAGFYVWQAKYYATKAFALGVDFDQAVYRFSYDVVMFFVSWTFFLVAMLLLQSPVCSSHKTVKWVVIGLTIVAAYLMVASLINGIM